MWTVDFFLCKLNACCKPIASYDDAGHGLWLYLYGVPPEQLSVYMYCALFWFEGSSVHII
jgi:hypothetical protein